MQNRSIPKTFIKDLLSITDIIELINSRIELKKKGKNYYAICPFHSEKTPSFTVSREKQFFYCFGCHIHGNSIDFLMKYENLSFINCIEEIASIKGLEVPNNINKKSSKYPLYKIMELINEIYHQELYSNTYNAILVNNFLLKRGIDKNIIKNFSIGYASKYWLNKFIKKNNKIKNVKEILFDLGILINKKNYIYDIFLQRITFPIRDRYGRLVGFGARTINNIKPKYINSPETKIFNKSFNLYGLYEVCKKNKNPSYIIIVEGYIDVLSLNQFGIYYVVSSLGTATNKNQIKNLFYITDHIICCYDGDIAGKKAAWNTLENTLNYMYDGCKLSFIFLPEGEDPDTIIRKEGKINFEKRINQAVSFADFLFSSIMSKVNISTYDGLVKFSEIICPLINKIPGNVIRIYMRKELAKIIGIYDENKLESFVSKKLPTFSFNCIKKTNMRILISLLLQNTKLAKIAEPSITFLKNLKLNGISFFLDLLKTCIKYPNISTGQLVELYRNDLYFEYIKKLAIWNHMIVEKEVKNVFKDVLSNLYDLVLKQKQDELIAREKIKGLTLKERNEFWSINLSLFKK